MTHVEALKPHTSFGDALRAQRVRDDRFGDPFTAARARAGKWMVRYFIRSCGAGFVVQRRVVGLCDVDQDVLASSLEAARAMVPFDFIALPRWPNDANDVVEIYG